MDNEDVLALDNQICFALYAANRAVTALYRPLLKELDLTYPQYLVMLVLWERERRGQRTRVLDLGRRLRLDSGTLTPLLKRLAERGLLRRERDPEDERVVMVEPTATAIDLRERAASIPGKLLCNIELPPERLLALREELKSVLEAIDHRGETSD